MAAGHHTVRRGGETNVAYCQITDPTLVCTRPSGVPGH